MTATAPSPDPSTQAPSPALAPPPGNPRFALFDSLRAIAVLGVLIFHVTSITGEINRPVIGGLFPVLGTQGLTLLLVRAAVLESHARRRDPRGMDAVRRGLFYLALPLWAAMIPKSGFDRSGLRVELAGRFLRRKETR
jgi:peptidoglycan/LPS O-acetylase OafA/YrhL